MLHVIPPDEYFKGVDATIERAETLIQALRDHTISLSEAFSELKHLQGKKGKSKECGLVEYAIDIVAVHLSKTTVSEKLSMIRKLRTDHSMFDFSTIEHHERVYSFLRKAVEEWKEHLRLEASRMYRSETEGYMTKYDPWLECDVEDGSKVPIDHDYP